MDFLSLAASRRSIRCFVEKEVPDTLVRKLLEAARWAPSAGNLQPWHFYVVKNKEMRERLCDTLQARAKWIHYAPVLIVVTALPKQSAARYHDRGGDLYCIQDTAAAIQNILLCAKDLGLGACWVGAFSEEDCASALGLHKDIRPVAIIPTGYVLEEPEATPRAPIEQIATVIE